MKNLIISSLLFAVVTMFSSCEEVIDKPDDLGEENTSVAITAISPESTYVRSALDIQADASFDTLTNYSISVGGEPADVVATNGTTVTVQVPLELSPGDHTVEITYQGESKASPNPLNVLDHNETTVDGLAMALSGNPEYPIVALTEEGEVLTPVVNPESGYTTRAIYMSGEIKTYVSFDEYLLPSIVNTAGYTMLFTNYTDIGFDVAIISPENELSIYRNLEVTVENQRNARLESDEQMYPLMDAAWGMSTLGCYLSEPMLTAGVPTAAVNGIAHCQSPLVLTATGALYDAPLSSIETSAPAFGVYASDFGCNQTMSAPYHESISDCSEILFAESIDLDLVANLLRDEHAENIELARQSLQYGGGDVQITLTWDNTADLDLHVIDPNGERIAYFSSVSSSGGMLDVDDVDGFGPENIFWQQQQAPQGDYQVEVNHYDGESPSNFTVLVQTLGQTRQYTGTIAALETISIVTFTLGETLPEGSFEPANLNARLLFPEK
ncbi:MAG: IPT/TIG domain-containing protein [Bacteroidota bacterium]